MLSDSPPDQQQVWSDARMQGAWRFLTRLWRTVGEMEPLLAQASGADIPLELDGESRALRQKTHECILKVTRAIEGGFRFNTAISSVMELLNLLRASKDAHPAVLREAVESLLVLIAPIVPHFSEEIWERLGHGESIYRASWPEGDERLARAETIEIPVQVNGKVKARIRVPAGLSREELEALALADAGVRAALREREIRKVIAVPGRIVNIAVG
ncbi:MAG: class I tRNA ligase family protein [Planctomycetota bacterium]